MNYLTFLSNLRDSVLYIGNLFSPSVWYITFYLFVRCGASQLFLVATQFASA